MKTILLSLKGKLVVESPRNFLKFFVIIIKICKVRSPCQFWCLNQQSSLQEQLLQEWLQKWVKKFMILLITKPKLKKMLILMLK